MTKEMFQRITYLQFNIIVEEDQMYILNLDRFYTKQEKGCYDHSNKDMLQTYPLFSFPFSNISSVCNADIDSYDADLPDNFDFHDIDRSNFVGLIA